MSKSYVKDNVPLSRFGVLVAQLESIVASAAHKSPDPLLCFDLLSDLISAIYEEPKESILLWQRKCEDALYSLLVLGARRPIRHLASVAMTRIILKGDAISIYSRASSLQGFLSDGKKNEPQQVAGAAQCLGELYRFFGRRITSGLLETTVIVTKLLKFNEDYVRQEALYMLKNALEGSGGNAAASAYMEAFRIIMRMGVGDKSFIVRIAAARCLKAFANVGGPGLGVGELENSSSYCVKALEDSISSVRDAFAEALGALLALGMNPDAQVQPRGKGHFTPKKLEGGLQRHLALPFTKASGPRSKELRVGLTLSWVSFLQAIRQIYLQPDSDLQNFAVQVIDMLHVSSVDAQALACVLYILRVGITDQMSEPTQRDFLVFLSKQLQSSDGTPSMRVAVLRTLSYGLKTLGEVPVEFKDLLDNTVVAALSHHSPLVRIEAALTLRALAEVDPSCIGGLISYAVTVLNAMRENLSFEKGTNLKVELDSLHGQAVVLAALVSVSPKLPLGYPVRLPRSVLEVSTKMLMESSRNPVAASVEREAGWTLLSSLLASMPKEELEDQVFDILSLWAPLFSRNVEYRANEDLTPTIHVWSAAVDALTAFIKRFLSSDALSKGILLQPVLLYLSRALSYISLLATKEQTAIKLATDVFIIRTLIAYQSLSDTATYRSDHSSIIQICTTPFRDASKCEESSCLRMLLDRRDAWLGPWVPGRDLFEDELRSFQGGKDGVLPSVWDNDLPSFPQPETIGKMLVNQMLLCFGTIFASQDSGGMLSLLNTVEQCLKAGKKQVWHTASVTNICVALLAGLKALLALRPEPLGLEILNAAQSIFQSILAEGDICASQRRACSEGLGLLARLGNDIFTARLTRLLLADMSTGGDSNYAGSVAVALGCIHRSAGGMALSSLVPATVNSLSSLAKSSVTSLQIWSLHGLILTIEAAGLSYVSQVQATLGLAMDILLSLENGSVDLQQGVGRLINAIVAVLGPELAPGSIFFSRCKSVVAEISSRQETATLLESVRFTQQLVLFAPQAVSVRSHVQSLLPTLSSGQPTLRHLALSTLRHLIEKDPVSIIDEQIEETLFLMLDEETDSEIGNLARKTIMRLLHASCPSRPSHWLSICRDMILATSARRDARTMEDDSTVLGGEASLNFGDDDENMVSRSKSQGRSLDYSTLNAARDKHLRYRTRVFAAECLSHLPGAVGSNPAHFDLSIARGQAANKACSNDWLVIKLQELISLAYQISTIQFENMRPIGVAVLSTIVDKFGMTPDPELPGHILLEQYQAQVISAVRTALDQSSGPVLLEAGLQLATKILTSGVISQDQVAIKRIFSLISRPLDDFNDLYYPSFAEWVSCKIKVRLLTAHASLKCYTYTFLKQQHDDIPDEYQALLPLFSKSSRILGKYWLSVLEDYCHICFNSHPINWRPFLDGIQSSLVSTRLWPCLEEAWPHILQALTLDAFPVNFNVNGSLATESGSRNIFTSGYSMVELKSEEFRFLYAFSLLALFLGQNDTLRPDSISVGHVKCKLGGDFPAVDANSVSLKPHGIVFPVLHSLCAERFFNVGFVTMDMCKELLQVISFTIFAEDTWDSLAVSVLSQIVQNCPKDFLAAENFSFLASEICSAFLFKFHLRNDEASIYYSNWEDISSVSLTSATKLLQRCKPKVQLKSVLGFLLIGYKCFGGAPTELCLARVNAFIQSISSILEGLIDDKFELEDDGIFDLTTICRAGLTAVTTIINHCIRSIHELQNKKSNFCKLLQMKLAFSLEQSYSLAKLFFDINNTVENEERNSILFSVLHHTIQCTRDILTDDDTQVLAIGLQVVKSVLQKGINADFNSFRIFFLGEIIGDVSLTIQKFLQKSINKEAVAVTGECFKILMLLQTHLKDSVSQKALISLILEVVVMVFSTSGEHVSQDFNDLKSTAIKVVSQLAQIPSSASYFKDVLVKMPITRRQQLQDIIRASVTQDRIPTHVKSSAVPLAIKLPAQTQKAREKDFPPPALTIESRDISLEKDSPPSAPTKASGDISEKKDSPPSSPAKESSDISEEEEEEDWDNFQSFPASTNESDPTPELPKEESNLVESPPILDKNTNYGSEGNSSSLLPTMEEECTAADQSSCERERTDENTSRNQIDETQDSNAETLDARHQEGGKVVVRHNDDQNLPEVQFAEEHPDIYETSKEIVETVPGTEKSPSSSDTKHVESSPDLSDDHPIGDPSVDKQSDHQSEQHVEFSRENAGSSDSAQQQQETKTQDSSDFKALSDHQSAEYAGV